jgi:hypothetical protein
MTRDHRATKTCRYSNDGSVSASAAVPAQKGADVDDHPSHFQARKRRPPGVLSTLIQRVPGRRLEAMNAHAVAQPSDPLSAATDPHSGRVRRAQHLGRRREPDSGGGTPPCGMGATAGAPGREGG